MNLLSHPEIIGIDVSRDWLDIHCLADGRQLRLPNTDDGHSQLAEIAGDRTALVCFEATGGQEWRLWASLEASGIPARQLPPAQVKAFGRSRGTLAKTDRIDAELIARFMAFRPGDGRCPSREKSRGFRTLTTTRRQFVEIRKCLVQQNKATGRTEPPTKSRSCPANIANCWSARSRRCPNSARVLESRPLLLQIWRPSRGTAGICAGNG